MSVSAGISGRGRAELATLLGAGRRFVTPTDVVGALDVDPDAAAKKLSRWAEEAGSPSTAGSVHRCPC